MIDTATTSPAIAFDTVTPVLYNEADVGRIAAAAAEQAVGKLLKRIPSGTAMLDNSINTSASSIQQDCGGSEMSDRLKAKVTVNGKTQWVCGESIQKLVDNAISLSKVPVINESISFGKYAKDYIALYKNNGSVEGNTLVGYRSYMSNHILPFFGDMPIDQITPDHIQQYINSKAQTYTQKTIKEHLNLIRPIFDSLLNNDYYFILADLEAFNKVIQQASADYVDRDTWAKKALLNMARIGYFSSDRSVMEYAKNIWHVEPVESEED